MTKKVVQALHDCIENFGIFGIVGEPGKNITTIVKFFLVVFSNLDEIDNLPSKAKLHMIEVFCNLSVDKFRDPFTLILNQENVEDLGKSIGLYNNIQITLKKIKGIF